MRLIASDYTEIVYIICRKCCANFITLIFVINAPNFSRSTRERIMTRATNVERKKLLSLGVCFGKFTKTGKFRLHITALDYLAPYAKVSLDLIQKSQRYCPQAIVCLRTCINIFYPTVQGLGEAIRRVVVPVWKPRVEGWSWSYY